MPRNRSNLARDRAREARKNPSAAEAIMWGYLRGQQTGFKFRREHPIGPYRLDFFCKEALLAVELDGEQHIKERDAIRDATLAQQGILTYRISNRVLFKLEADSGPDFIREITQLCESRTRPDG